MVARPDPEYPAALAELGRAGRMSIGTFHALGGTRSGPALTWMVGHGMASLQALPIQGAEQAGRLWEIAITEHGRAVLERRKLRP